MLADATFSTEAIVVASALLVGLSGAVVVIFKMLIAAKDEQLKDSESRAQSYKEMAEEAIKNLEAKVNELRSASGRPNFPVVPDVVPEHNSPTSPKQQATADLQTLRARLVAATVQLGLPAREAAPPVAGEGGES